MADIEFTKDGAKKVTQERFKDALVAEGWEVVEKKKAGRPAKKKDKGDE